VLITVEWKAVARNSPAHPATGPISGQLSSVYATGADRLPQEKEMIQRPVQATDEQIDRLVYELYGLSEEEIKIVEGG